MLTQTFGRATWIAVGGLLLLALGIGANAGDGDFSFGDDLIGSLPVMYPEDKGGGLTSGAQTWGGELDISMDCTLVLTGTAKDVEDSILNAYGTGWVEVEQAEIAGEYDFAFHGDVTLDLDRVYLERGRIRSTARPGLGLFGGMGQVSWKGTAVMDFAIQGSDVLLPYGSLLLNGTVDAGTVGLDMLSRTLSSAYLGVSTYGSVAQIEQIVY